MIHRLKQRFWEIDFARGVAIVMMIIFHTLFDINYFYNTNINLLSGFWRIFQLIIPSIFLLLVGVSLSISNRNKRKLSYLMNFKRGVIILFWGILISLITFILFPHNFIIFGILHMIGIAIMIAYPFLGLKHINIFLGFLVILIGNLINNIHSKIILFLPFGVTPMTYNYLDYYPLFPWFGFVLFGLSVGNMLYVRDNTEIDILAKNNKNNKKNKKNIINIQNIINMKNIYPIKELSSSSYNGCGSIIILKRNFKIFDLSQYRVVKFFMLLGRNSLKIYLIHQIVLFGALYLIGFFI